MQRTYEQDIPIAAPGLISGLGEPRINTYTNANSAIADTWELAIPSTPTADLEYTITVNGITVAYTATGTDTQNSLGLALYGAIIHAPNFYGLVSATYDATADTITLEGRSPGQVLTVTSNLTATRTANAGTAPEAVPFGRFVAAKTTYKEGEATLPTAASDELRGIVMSTHFIQRVGVPAGRAAHLHEDEMNVIEDTLDLKGVWVEAVEATIVPSDPVYVSVAAGHQGKVTKTSSGNIAALTAVFRNKSQMVGDKILVLVALHRP